MSAAFDRSIKGSDLPLSRPDGPVLMVYLEPTPYIVGLVEHVGKAWCGRVDVAYVETSRSQPWGCQIRSENEFVLPRGFASSVAAIRKRLASGRYALVHLAGWGHPILVATLLMAKLYRIPVAMESDTPRPAKVATWKSIAKWLVYPWLFSLPSVFLPGGTRQAMYLRDYGVRDAKIRIAQMSVDVDHIKSHVKGREQILRGKVRERFRINEHAVCLLYMGRLESHKGIEELIESYRAVAQKRRDVALVVAGDGSLRDVVRAAEAETESIRYVGRLSGDEVWEAYCAADILILPSRAEPWGLVVNEAMAVGLPVIVSDRVGCIDDIVRNESTGLVVPAESPEKLAAAIMRLVDEPELRTKIGAQGAKLISGWTLGNQADRTVQAWRCAIA